MAAIVAAQEVGRVPPERGKKMISTPIAAQKAAGAAPTTAKAGVLPEDDDEGMATSVAAQEAAEASLTAVEVGKPILKICMRRETSVAAQD
jgi:hypothetical protein